MTYNEPPRFDQTLFSQRAEVLDVVLDHVPQGIVVVGRDYRTLAFNRPMDDLFELPAGSIRVGGDYREVIEIWARETGQDEAMRARALAELDHPEHFEFEFPQLVHGEPRWIVLTHDPVPGGGFVRTFTDITERKRLEAKLLELSSIDSLSGLLNRRTFLEAVKVEIERHRRYRRPLTLLSIDLDHFKQINDNYGHPMGDRVIRAFAQSLAACMRKCDAVGRTGGEEFGVLLPETSLDQGLQAARLVLNMVRKLTVEVPDRKGMEQLTVSIGVAELEEHTTVEELIARADEALYRAKREGRDRFLAALREVPATA
jgi:diguanylate cyclase (GGDEF)-like protein